MTDKILLDLQNWLKETREIIDIPNAYVFGSLIYRDGMNLKSEFSDIDVIILIPDNLKSPIKRLDWLRNLKNQKKVLEQRLLLTMGKDNGHEEIISMTPYTQIEAQYDIHKSCVRVFLQPNELLNLDNGEIKLGYEIFEKIDINHEDIIQVLEKIQKKRNEYLKTAASKDYTNLNWSGQDILPKDFSRNAAQINGIIKGYTKLGDKLNPSFGNDFIKSIISDNIDSDKQYFELYKWIDDRSGGRANSEDKSYLSEEKHVLLYEILYNKVIEIISEFKIKDEKLKRLSDGLISKLEYNSEFQSFLENATFFTKAHNKKEHLILSDIYVFPEFKIFDETQDKDKFEDSLDFLKSIADKSNLLIAGDDQIGKTALCKKMIPLFLELDFLPLYINDKENSFQGSFDLKIQKAFTEQFNSDLKIENFSLDKIIIIIDDFHFAKKQESILKELEKYGKTIIIVDDIFQMNFRDEEKINSFKHCKILPFVPSLRNKLIKKWLLIGDGENINKYDDIDALTELINSSIGKIFGSSKGGIMPSYPFLILSVLSTHEDPAKTSFSETTSQGHCYQALIILYLKNNGVNSQKIDAYINFLTQLASFIYDSKHEYIPESEIDVFLNIYDKNFNSTIEFDEMLNILKDSNIFLKDEMNNFRFSQQYLFLFFCGKYFAENSKLNSEKINHILQNLHTTKNAYIAVFISHHLRSDELITEIVKVSKTIFSKNELATLTKDELKFMDEKDDLFAKAVLPKSKYTPERNRIELLKQEDDKEHMEMTVQKREEKEEKENEFSIELRRSIRTVEVMGQIIKNRSGSLKKHELISIFEEGLKTHLRVLNHFIELIKDDKNQLEIVDFITSKLDNIITEKELKPNIEKLEKLAKQIFWNTNFSVMFSLIDKAIHSLGSKDLIKISKIVTDNINSPVSFIVHHGILLWYGKNLQLDAYDDREKQKDFSSTATKILDHKIVNHCRLHPVSQPVIQEIQRRRKIPNQILQAQRFEQVMNDKKNQK